MKHQQHLGDAWLEKDKNGKTYIKTNCKLGRGKIYGFPNNHKTKPSQPDFVIVATFEEDVTRAVEEKKDV